MGPLTLRPLIADEGVWGDLRIVRRLCRDTEARGPVLAIRRVFQKRCRHFAVIMFAGKKGNEMNLSCKSHNPTKYKVTKQPGLNSY